MPRPPAEVRAIVAAERALASALALAAALALATPLRLLGAPLAMLSLATLLAAEALARRWIVADAIALGLAVGELVLAVLLWRAGGAAAMWALPLVALALMGAAVLGVPAVRRWLKPAPVARFEVVARG